MHGASPHSPHSTSSALHICLSLPTCTCYLKRYAMLSEEKQESTRVWLLEIVSSSH